MTNETVHGAVPEAVYWAGNWAVYRAFKKRPDFLEALHLAVIQPVNRAVYQTLGRAVNVRETFAQYEEPPQLGLAVYLGGVPR